MTVVEQERETEVIVGTVVGITQKKVDSWTVAVQPDGGGSNYPKNLWTKNDTLVTQLQGYLHQRLMFECGVSPWTNSQGQPVRSLWINEVKQAPDPQQGDMQTLGQQGIPQQVIPQPAPVEQSFVQPPLQQPQAPAPAPQAQAPAPVSDPSVDAKEWRIMREAASKNAVATLPFLPSHEHSHEHLVEIAEGWVRYFLEGPQPFDGEAHDAQAQQVFQRQGNVATPQPQGFTMSAEAGPAPGQFAADDIPF